MRTILTSDEDLIRRLPLPLAQQYRRACNAKTALERHLAAFYLWEAWLKLLAVSSVVAYAEMEQHDPGLAERLKALARPSLGNWLDFVRGLVPALAAAGAGGYDALRDFLYGKARADLPRAAQLDAALCQALDIKGGGRGGVRLPDLFDHLVQYRNRELGHGASGQRSGDFYEGMGRALLAGVSELIGRADALAGRQLLYVAEVRGLASGGWLLDRYDLTGETARRLEPLELATADASRLPRARSVYVGTDGVPERLLGPLLLYEEDTQEFFYLNSRRGRRRAEYLCYSTGRTLDHADLGGDRRALLARVLDVPVTEETDAAWAARSQAEEAPESAAEEKGSRRTLGEFELLGKLGQGGMGAVYRARQPSLGRQVAVKLLLRTGDAKAEARFTREIRALGKVEHPNLVRVFACGTEGEQLYYAMELMEGADLGCVCERLAGRDGAAGAWEQAVTDAYTVSRSREEPLDGASPPPPPTAPASPPDGAAGRDRVRPVVELVRQVAEAAHALHEAGVVHRDVKPGNIMVSPDGRHAVLMDLGLAQLADDGDTRLTRTRQFVGTLRYASPEQILAGDRIDRRSDVYSLGVTLWELLTLRPMYGVTDDMAPFEVEKRITLGGAESPRKYNRRVPADLDAVVLKCLEKDPARRYQTAGDLAADLGRFLAGDPVRARPIGPARRALRWARRRPLRTAGIAAALFLLVAGGLGLWYWDAHYRVKTEYYANYVLRRGVPEGVGRLTDEQVRHRFKSYRISRRNGRVESLEVVNSQGKPFQVNALQAQLGGNPDAAGLRRECRHEYHHDAQGHLIKEVACDRAGGVVWCLQYTHTDDTMSSAHYTDRQHHVQARTRSGAAFVDFTWSPEGYLTEVRFSDPFGNPQPNEDGIFGKLFERDERGLELGVTNLGEDFEPAPHPDGYVQVRNDFDAFGNAQETSYWGPDRKLALHKNGYSRVARKYDAYGNETESAYFGLKGEKVLHRNGFHKDLTGYDDAKLQLTTTYQGLDGGPAVSLFGHAGAIMQWDMEGNLKDLTFLGANGKPCTIAEGYARAEFESDRYGNCTAVAFFGPAGEPTFFKDGYHRKTAEYDDHGNVLRERLFGLDDKSPARHRDGGFTRSEMAYDEHDRRKAQSFYDARTRLKRHEGFGYARWTGQYDGNGNLVVQKCFNELEAPVVSFNGDFPCEMNYDARGNRTKVVFLDVRGEPLPTDGIAGFTQEFDARGNWTARHFLGPDRQPAAYPGGMAAKAAEYDEVGNQTRELDLGLDGKPAPGPGGIAEWRAWYDPRGNCVKRMLGDGHGNWKLHPDGYAGWESHFDDRGNEVERTYLDTEGAPVVVRTRGYARKTVEYDTRGRATRFAYFDRAGRSVRVRPEGAAGWTQQYDTRGNLTELAYFGPDDKPVRMADGYVRIRFAYDPSGSRTDAKCLDAEEHELPTETVVKSVDPGKPGDVLGLRAEDVLLTYDGNRVVNGTRWAYSRRDERDGDPPKDLCVRRGKQTLTLHVPPGRLGVITKQRVAPPAS